MLGNSKKNIRWFASLIISVLFFYPGLAIAKEKNWATLEYQKCIDSQSSNRGWAICGQDEINRQEKRLAEAWKRVLGDMQQFFREDELTVSDLMEEQEKWTKWKDSSCEFYHRISAGRESAVLTYPMCKVQTIVERVNELNNIAKELEAFGSLGHN